MSYAFTFDATFCSGCKACQAACKDKNNLPLGVLWRRVIEVSGGTWQQNGEAWCNTVFAYNLSISCNHCIHPKCAGICPTNAYAVREDGIVILDTTKCMGCGYCSWACPYGVPQYNAESGQMTKCDFCFDNLEQGLPPACVAACPMRVLDYREMPTVPVLTANEMRLWDVPAEAHPYPLPNYSRTQARIIIKQHAAMNASEEKFVANLEELQPRIPSKWEDLPLILFTLLVQMAVGSLWAMLWMFPRVWVPMDYGTTLLQLLPSLLIGACLGGGMFISFAHLGTKRNAWRALGNLRRSRLSREILFLGLFATGWLLTTLASMIQHTIQFEWIAVTAILGIGLIYNMSEVYRLRAVPAWNTWRTNVSFIVSAVLLGLTVMATLLSYEANVTNVHVPPGQWKIIGSIILISLLAQLATMQKRGSQSVLQNMRIGLIVGGMAVSAIGLFSSNLNVTWLSILIFLIVLTEEALGRWIFYRSRVSSFTQRKGI